MIWILNLLPEPANPGDAPEDVSFGHNRQTFIQNWPYVLVPGTFSTKIQEKKRQTYKTHLVLPISNFFGTSRSCQCFLSFPRRGTDFDFHGNPLWTGSKRTWPLVPKGWFRALQLHPPCTILYWRMTSRHPLSLAHTNYSSHTAEALSEIFPVPCPRMLPKQDLRLYFLYCHLPVRLTWRGTLCSEWYDQRQYIDQLSRNMEQVQW